MIRTVLESDLSVLESLLNKTDFSVAVVGTTKELSEES